MTSKAVHLAQGAAQPLCGAAWTPDSQALLVANKGSKQLVALYFTQKPPGMEAQTFPVSLPPSGTSPEHTANAENPCDADQFFFRCLSSPEDSLACKLVAVCEASCGLPYAYLWLN